MADEHDGRQAQEVSAQKGPRERRKGKKRRGRIKPRMRVVPLTALRKEMGLPPAEPLSAAEWDGEA